MSASRILITFGLLLTVALVVGWHSLDYPMVYDDLHLIRHFSGKEIRGAFTGHWDPDEIETPGFRPFTVLFNHARYHAFGENVVAHRVFLLLRVHLISSDLRLPVTCLALAGSGLPR
jgi:hypothetical protein